MNSTINVKDNEEQALDILWIFLCRTQNYKAKTTVVSVQRIERFRKRM